MSTSYCGGLWGAGRRPEFSSLACDGHCPCTSLTDDYFIDYLFARWVEFALLTAVAVSASAAHQTISW